MTGDAVEPFDRRNILKLGAAGAALAGFAVSRAAPAAADSVAFRGVHLHATLLVLDDLPGGPSVRRNSGTLPGLGVNLRFNINIEVWGPDSDLSGTGWGALADQHDPKQTSRIDATQRVFTQRGALDGDVLRLTGRMLFSYVPGDVGGPIVTEANLTTGHIRFIAGNTASSATLEGTGVVIRI
jgi:hypothetical protein